MVDGHNLFPKVRESQTGGHGLMVMGERVERVLRGTGTITMFTKYLIRHIYRKSIDGYSYK